MISFANIIRDPHLWQFFETNKKRKGHRGYLAIKSSSKKSFQGGSVGHLEEGNGRGQKTVGRKKGRETRTDGRIKKERKEWAQKRRRIHYVRRRESFRIVCRVDRPPPWSRPLAFPFTRGANRPSFSDLSGGRKRKREENCKRKGGETERKRNPNSESEKEMNRQEEQET